MRAKRCVKVQRRDRPRRPQLPRHAAAVVVVGLHVQVVAPIGVGMPLDTPGGSTMYQCIIIKKQTFT